MEDNIKKLIEIFTKNKDEGKLLDFTQIQYDIIIESLKDYLDKTCN